MFCLATGDTAAPSESDIASINEQIKTIIHHTSTSSSWQQCVLKVTKIHTAIQWTDNPCHFISHRSYTHPLT